MNIGVLQRLDWLHSGAEEVEREIRIDSREGKPDLNGFAREQLRGLVRRVFFSETAHPIRQVVFSPSEPQMAISELCHQLGLILAQETPASVVVACGERSASEIAENTATRNNQSRIRSFAHQVRNNLWRVSTSEFRRQAETNQSGIMPSLHSHLWELRRDFQYSIVEAPAASASSEAAALGRVADGLILVLAAHSTRRVIARQIKESLEASHTRILGTVLSGRRFPIPEGIYRRL